jgi:tRNA pseudouridine32 synthase/23S rRNA pseudouridine746 synthase
MSANADLRLVYRTTAASGETRTACGILAEGTGLSKGRIKEAMLKGAVWRKAGGKGEKRLRRASHRPAAGEELAVYYDPRLLVLAPPRAECRHDAGRYSVWAKPAGLLTQGSRYGDHASLLFQAERHFRPPRSAFPVHRLDREAQGLVLIAHSREAAAALSRLFVRREVEKRYRIEVRGDIGTLGPAGRIASALDGRPAETDWVLEAFDPERRTSTVTVTMRSGRRHQIRRHFERLGFPVMGDPAYGRGNKDPTGLKLEAFGLAFTCPFSAEPMKFAL